MLSGINSVYLEYEMEQRKYGLFTAITTIVGIVIGSGIYFKSSIVLEQTGGSVIQGVIAFCVAAVSIIFGSLSLTQLASRTDRAGGLITYADTYWNKKVSGAFGWFSLILYYPPFLTVIGWIGGVYICDLFGWESTLEKQVLLGLALITFCFAINMYNAKWGGKIQDAATVLKIIPLILFIFAGLFYGKPEIGINYAGVDPEVTSGSWLKALPMILFTFDGWVLVTSICHEIKDSKRNLPLALTISPLIILVLYVGYFVGLSNYFGVENILAAGSAHLSQAAAQLLGNQLGAKLIITLVVISVLGVTNGVSLTLIRVPYSLSIRKMIPNSEKYDSVDKKHGVSLRSAGIAYFLAVFWMGVHYITQKTGVMGNGDISEIACVANVILLIILYIAVIRLAVRGEIKNKFYGYICPVLAILGSCVLLYSGFTNPLFPYFLTGSIVVLFLGWLYVKTHPEIETIEVTEE